MLHHNSAGEPCGMITNIQKYTIHDGPGIRTEIFFKGCTMHCLWCSNPETISPMRQIGVYPKRCMTKDKCSWCVKSCPLGGSPIVFGKDEAVAAVNMTDVCVGCFKCTDECPGHAIMAWGDLMTVPELMKIIREDMDYYERNGGGVTLNGGEVMVQWEFAEMLLKACHEEGINTCVETAMCVPFEHIERVMRYTDLVITDIKHMDSDTHRKYTGQKNDMILENIRRVAQMGKKIVLRTPVVLGYNSDDENMRRIAEFVKNELGDSVVAYQLLPYRKMGTEKYDSLGVPYPMDDYKVPERSEWEPVLLHLEDMLKNEYGLPAVAGSSKKLNI